MPRTPSSPNQSLARRSFLGLAATAAPLFAQTARDWTNRNPIRYPDPDVVAIDRGFAKYQVFNAVLYRHYVGTRWAEGPAWSAEGSYVVWSDIPNNRQLRLIEEDDHVAVFRSPSGYSNGNTFDFEGRQISCGHAGRRVVRYEHNGHATVLAERYNGKPLNSPNDVVVHPDGGIWFSDPTYGIMGNYEGFQATSELKEAFYRIDPHTARIELVWSARAAWSAKSSTDRISSRRNGWSPGGRATASTPSTTSLWWSATKSVGPRPRARSASVPTARSSRLGTVISWASCIERAAKERSDTSAPTRSERRSSWGRVARSSAISRT